MATPSIGPQDSSRARMNPPSLQGGDKRALVPGTTLPSLEGRVVKEGKTGSTPVIYENITIIAKDTFAGHHHIVRVDDGGVASLVAQNENIYANAAAILANTTAQAHKGVMTRDEIKVILQNALAASSKGSEKLTNIGRGEMFAQQLKLAYDQYTNEHHVESRNFLDEISNDNEFSLYILTFIDERQDVGYQDMSIEQRLDSEVWEVVEWSMLEEGFEKLEQVNDVQEPLVSQKTNKIFDQSMNGIERLYGAKKRLHVLVARITKNLAEVPLHLFIHNLSQDEGRVKAALKYLDSSKKYEGMDLKACLETKTWKKFEGSFLHADELPENKSASSALDEPLYEVILNPQIKEKVTITVKEKISLLTSSMTSTKIQKRMDFLYSQLNADPKTKDIEKHEIPIHIAADRDLVVSILKFLDVPRGRFKKRKPLSYDKMTLQQCLNSSAWKLFEQKFL